MKPSGWFLLLAPVCLSLISCPSMSGTQSSVTPLPQDQTATTAPDGLFTVPKELYTQTFAEIEALITRLNEIIAEKDYDNWLSYLSPGYIEKTGSPDFLREASKSPILQGNRIVLKTLKDYFLYVVVPSRVQARLEEISFIDKTRVKAISLIGGKPVILYWLVLIDSRWMIGVP